MNGLSHRRVGGGIVLTLVVVAGFFSATALSGRAPAATTSAATDAGGAVQLRMNLQRFEYIQRQHRLVAHGQVVASYRQGGQVRGATAKAVVLSVQQGTSCRVLHLELGELRLNLLGLVVTLTPVDQPNIVLDISANSDEALGKLLCQLIGSLQSGKLARTAKATQGLNTVVRKKYSGGVMNVQVPLRSRAAAATTTGTSTGVTTGTTTTPGTGQCEVLNLVLGPLNLDLLGLVVQLNKVQLDISANPVGALGTLFCQLAGGTIPLTTAITGLTTNLSTTGATPTTASTMTTTTASTTT